MKKTKHLLKALLLMAAVFFFCGAAREVRAEDFTWSNGSTKALYLDENYSCESAAISSAQTMYFENKENKVMYLSVIAEQTYGVAPTYWAVLNDNADNDYSGSKTLMYSRNTPYNCDLLLFPGEKAGIYILGDSDKRFKLKVYIDERDFGDYIPKGKRVNLTLNAAGTLEGEYFQCGHSKTNPRPYYEYHFTLTNPKGIRLESGTSSARYKIAMDDLTNVVVNHSTAAKTISLNAGTHVLYIIPDQDQTYEVKYSVSQPLPETTGVTFNNLPASVAKGQRINITAQTVPAVSKSTIDYIKVDGVKLTIPTGQNTVTVPYTVNCKGYIKVEAYTTNDQYIEKKVYIGPDTPTLNYSGFSTTHNTVTYSKPADYQAQIMIGGKWVNYSGSQGGLAPNTAYPVRVRAFAGSPVGTLYSAWSAPVTLRTNTNVLPGFKSVKISKAKVKKKKVWINGYWKKDLNRYIWVKGYYTTRYTTSYKVTVKLKKAPGAAGMIVNTVRHPGNKKTYTYNITEQGKRKGKKATLVIGFYNNTGWNNQSITKTYKVKIK